MKAQGLATHQCIAHEVTQAAGLGPREVDAQCHQHEQQVDDPDAKVLAARAGKGDGDLVGRWGNLHLGIGCVQWVGCAGRGSVYMLHAGILLEMGWGL